MNIPFSPPFIDTSIENEVLDCLRSGWITTGPKVKALEEEIELYTGAHACICVNSWTSGAIMMLKWFGIGEGDEVIVPAYTYSATALAVLHCGAKPIMVDIGDDFVVNADLISKAITSNTKAILPVDIGGWPVDYDAILEVLKEKQKLFKAKNFRQDQLGRILLISDAAHSFGAKYKGKYLNSADVIIYSFHAVKNLTTAEGGAIILNLPIPFDNVLLKPELKRYALNGQSKDALAKSQAGNWKYDIVELGFKYNMPDICAAIGLAQIKNFPKLINERIRVFKLYNSLFSDYDWAILPIETEFIRSTSAHLYMLRIKGITEIERDKMINYISSRGISVNVHFIPMPMMTLFLQLGYNILEYPNTYKQYSCEISLPIYPQLNDAQVRIVVSSVVESYYKIKC